MKIKILFDKEASNKNIRTGWGISFLIDEKVLFDTGEKGEWLFENMQTLGIAISKIESVVISHDHWDHWGGLWDILKERKGINVYSCPGFGEEFKDRVKKLKGNLVEVEKITKISQNIYITGEMPGSYRGKYISEQAAVLKTNNGLTIITGCAHPGILKIIENVRSHFLTEPIYFVSGGFHLVEFDKLTIEAIAKNFKRMGVIKTGPAHCSGNMAEHVFKEYYKGDLVPIKAGQELEV